MDKVELAAMRADEAARILNSALFASAFDDVKAALLKTWTDLPTADAENARDIHRRLKCLEQVRKVLETHIQTGKLARKELDGREQRPFSLQGVRNALTNLKTA